MTRSIIAARRQYTVFQTLTGLGTSMSCLTLAQYQCTVVPIVRVILANPGSIPHVCRLSTGNRVRCQSSIEPIMSQHASAMHLNSVDDWT